MSDSQHYFFIGVGGSGMSALADLVLSAGNRVSGSDRGRDRGDVPTKFEAMENHGITLFPQDGSGITKDIDFIVVSSAIEETIPDIQHARALNIPILKRAELLARMFNLRYGVGIAGTSGKTTVTGMTGWVLHAMGAEPTIANGGVMPNFIGHPDSLMGNAVGGRGDVFVAEMDESDGTIAFFNPAIAVLNNITLDHKPFDVIEPMFQSFLTRARVGAVVNIDDERAARMAACNPVTLTIAIHDDRADLRAFDLRHMPGGISFKIHNRKAGTDHDCTLAVPGAHNVLNALCALGAVLLMGKDLDQAIAALEQFQGIRRRMEVLGRSAGGITVIDDFGHNPDKVAASLATLAAYPGRVLIMFQPHGFGPMKMMRSELVSVFIKGMREGDILAMPEIFYAGGTATRDISSRDLIDDIARGGRETRFFDNRNLVRDYFLSVAAPGDRIVIMGARDDSLTDFARSILSAL